MKLKPVQKIPSLFDGEPETETEDQVQAVAEEILDDNDTETDDFSVQDSSDDPIEKFHEVQEGLGGNPENLILRKRKNEKTWPNCKYF